MHIINIDHIVFSEYRKIGAYETPNFSDLCTNVYEEFNELNREREEFIVGIPLPRTSYIDYAEVELKTHQLLYEKNFFFQNKYRAFNLPIVSVW